jgi:hypothetical protein
MWKGFVVPARVPNERCCLKKSNARAKVLIPRYFASHVVEIIFSDAIFRSRTSNAAFSFTSTLVSGLEEFVFCSCTLESEVAAFCALPEVDPVISTR